MPLLSSIAGLVDNFNVGPLTVNRPGLPSQNARGAYVTAPPSTFALDPVAAVQASGRSLLSSPEADRNEGGVEFYAKVRLHVTGYFAAFHLRCPLVRFAVFSKINPRFCRTPGNGGFLHFVFLSGLTCFPLHLD